MGQVVPEIHNIGSVGCGDNCHYPTVTVSGWLRQRFWVRCWWCELKIGPFSHRDDAISVILALEHLYAVVFTSGFSQS